MKLPSGTRIYQTDQVVVTVGNHLYVVAGDGTATRGADGSIVIRGASGKILRSLPASATITNAGTAIRAVLPGAKLPQKFENATPTEVIP